MPKVRLQDPSTGKFVWVEAAAVQPDGSTQATAAPSDPQESARSGPTPATSNPSHPAETQPRGSTPRAARPSKPRDDLDEFFEGDGTETVDREDL